MSIPATEHSVMTSWHTERQALQHMIQEFGTGLFACVMDSYDYVQVPVNIAAHATAGLPGMSFRS